VGNLEMIMADNLAPLLSGDNEFFVQRMRIVSPEVV
jgi:hypothetical protein